MKWGLKALAEVFFWRFLLSAPLYYELGDIFQLLLQLQYITRLIDDRAWKYGGDVSTDLGERYR